MNGLEFFVVLAGINDGKLTV